MSNHNLQSLHLLFRSNSNDQIIAESRYDVLREGAKSLGLKPACAKKDLVAQIREELEKDVESNEAQLVSNRQPSNNIVGHQVEQPQGVLPISLPGQGSLTISPNDVPQSVLPGGQSLVAFQSANHQLGGLSNNLQVAPIQSQAVTSSTQLLGDIESCVASIVSAELAKIKKDLEGRENALWQVVDGVSSVVSAANQLWSPRVFSNAMRQELYDDLIKVGKIVSKLESRILPPIEEDCLGRGSWQ